jgi:YVTN family beta-propeller protein
MILVFALVTFRVTVVSQSHLIQEAWADVEIKTVKVGDFLVDLEYNEANKDIYVANRDNTTVSVIDSFTNNVTHRIPVGESPSALEFIPQTNEIYVGNRDNPPISIINTDTNKVTHKIDLHSPPYALLNSGDKTYASNFETSEVSILVNETLFGTVKNLTSGPFALEQDRSSNNPNHPDIYVANTLARVVTEIGG